MNTKKLPFGTVKMQTPLKTQSTVILNFHHWLFYGANLEWKCYKWMLAQQDRTP